MSELKTNSKKIDKFMDRIYTRFRQLDDYVCYDEILRIKDFYHNFLAEFETQYIYDKLTQPITVSIMADHDIIYAEIPHISRYITEIFDSSFTLPFEGSQSNSDKRHLKFLINAHFN
jgi:hypothetical protein